MDPEVLKRFIEFLEKTLGRINSKRVMVLFGYLFFLNQTQQAPDAVQACGLIAFLLTMWFLWRQPEVKGDSLDAPKA